MTAYDHLLKKQIIRCALISASNKTHIIDLALGLLKFNIKILATGKSTKLLKENGIDVIEVAEYTGFPEILNGRVKTLHPKIHAGLLARPKIDDPVMEQHQIPFIDLLVVNLYPFANTISNPNCAVKEAIEQIDVGGPSMLRAAAKNYERVTVLSNPEDYAAILKEMQSHNGATTLATRQKLAEKTFYYLTQYDAQIAHYLKTLNETSATTSDAFFPNTLHLDFQKHADLRYGENPHQAAALYQNQAPGLLNAEQLSGKPMSFNNWLDADCAYRCVNELSQDQAACVIVKHATPSGSAQSDHILKAYQHAYQADPQSAFGGIIAFNILLDPRTAEHITSQQFCEVIIAPAFDPAAITILKRKKQLRLLIAPSLRQPITPSLSYHNMSGGLLIQASDPWIQTTHLTVASHKQPTQAILEDLVFAFRIAKYAKSNAIVYAKNQMTLGIGTGQTSRVFAAKIAIMKAEAAGLSLKNAVMASDGFFPFSDSIQLAHQAGITAIIQPGGSKRDPDVIQAANDAGIIMLLTGQRHFRH